MQNELVVAACFLVAVAVACLTWIASVLAARSIEACRQMQKGDESRIKLTEKLMELAQVDYVAQHLRRYGVGGYLVTANERIAEDVTAIEQWLGLTTAEAIAYLKSGLRQSGSEPQQHPIANGRPLSGEGRSVPNDR